MQHTFVSRDNELAAMDRMLAHAVEGRGQVCFVTGEAGFGKTSLTAEFARRAQKQNAELLVAVGDCNSQTGAGDPYLPFREVLAMLAGDIDDRLAQGMTTEENASRLRQYLRVSKRIIMEVGPDLIDIFVPGIGLATKAGVLAAGEDGLLKRRRAPAGAASSPTAPTGWAHDNDQSRIFEQVTRVLVTLAADRPLILILDDLHWIDDSSAGLLFHIARRIEGSRILIVGTYRPEEVTLGRGGSQHPLQQIVPELKRNYGEVIVELGGEGEAEGRRFVEQIIDSEPNELDRTFRDRLFERTRGHPLFTTELLRDMYERGAVEKDERGVWIAGPDLDWEQLPARAEGVIEERVNRLPGELQRLLTVGSVEGEEFTAQIVARLLNLDERKVLTLLTQELDRKHRLVSEESTGRVGRARISRFRFRHQLFQQYFYENLGMSERELMHEDVALQLEALHAERRGPVAMQLAHHFELAGLPDRAAAYYLQAGQRAMHMYAFREASGCASRGLECLGDDNAGATLRFELELLLGDAQLNGGQINEAMATFRTTAERALAGGNAEIAARAAMGYTEPRWRYNMMDGVAIRLLRDALALQDETDSTLRARLLASTARASEGLKPADELMAMLGESVAMARRLGDPAVLIDCARFRFSLDRDPARIRERIELGAELATLSQQIDNKYLQAHIHFFHICDCAAVGDIPAWRSSLEAMNEAGGASDDPFNTYNVQAMRVALPLMYGQFDEAEKCAMEAFETGQRLGVDNVQGVMGVQMFTIRREQGRLREVAPVVQHFVKDRGVGAAWRPGLALIYADLGRLDDARVALDELAAGGFAIVPRDSLWQTCLVYLAEVCDALQDRERGQVVYDWLAPYHELSIVVGNTAVCLGAASRYLGQLARMLGRLDDAETHFEQALALDERMGATPWLAHTRYQFARLLEERGGDERARRAEELRRDATATAQALGMVRLLAIAQ